MATLLPLPKARFFSIDGTPLVGGKVLTYAAGTTTPLASYTDSTGAVANTNPVILDAAGEANIWLGDALYKIVLQDSAGATQWTVDNVGDISAVTSTTGFGQATEIASATQVDLGTVASHFVSITGTTTITSFGSTATVAAPIYLIKFNGALTLTHSANLLLPASANITTEAQDRAWCEYLGSGAWRVISYMRASGLGFGVTPIANGGTSASTLAGAQAALNIFQNVQVFTASGTFTPTFTGKVYVRGQAGGGGGGGTSGANSLGACGGGAGGYFEGWLSVTNGVGVTVTVGAAGTGASAGNNTGGAGGNTTVGSMTAVGGSGGQGTATFGVNAVGGAGGTASGGSINIVGASGGVGLGFSGAGYWGGMGATSPIGGGGGRERVVNTDLQGTGFAAAGYGGGGGGGVSSGTAQGGGAGAAGVVMIYYP
jgi:hypothetical protein